jgi:hypothetical protein
MFDEYFNIRVKSIFSNTENICFHLFLRDSIIHSSEHYVKTYFNASAETMMNCLVQCDYVFVANPKELYIRSIGLRFSCL